MTNNEWKMISFHLSSLHSLFLSPLPRLLFSLSSLRRIDPSDAIERRKEIGPGLPLFVENLAPGGCHFVVAPPALSRFLNPASLNPPARLEPVEHRIERCDVKLEHGFGTLLDQLRDLVVVARPVINQD